MKLKELKKIIKEDFYSYNSNNSQFILYLKNPGFKITVWMRICKYLSLKKMFFFIYLLSRLKYRKLQVKYGIQIDYRLDVGGGFNIHHYGGIVINRDCKIGKNFSIRHNITIGNTDKGTPVIGNNVYIGPNSVLIGNISIGDNCIIGAGSVVTKSFANNCIIAGNPAKILRKI